MDSGLGSSSVEDVAAVEAPAVVVLEQTGQQQQEQQQVPDCCQMAMAEGGDCAKCGEPRSLNEGLVEELNLVFERRLRIVEQHGNDMNYKIALYEDWVKQLRLVNLDLVGAIKEMQDTCSDRLELMRANYKKNLARFGPETLRRLECDKDSLLEVIRRASATGKWDMNGIKLCDISLDQLFGKNNDIRGEAPAAGPTISVNLEVSSNCQLENTKVEELLQELEAKERQIKHLEYLLKQQLPVIHGSPNDTESDFRPEDCDTINEPLMNQLRQLINRKNQELQQQSAQIHELCTELTSLKSKIEENDLSSQFDSDLSQSLAEFKIEDSDASNRKLLQQLQNLSRFKSEQLEAVNRENEELRKDVKSLQAKVSKQSNRDNESLINEINDHHDKNCRLEKQLRDVELLLREANLAVAHRQKVIDTLRRDKVGLKKSLALAAVTGPASILHKSVSNPSFDTASICSSESTISFSSVNSDSSSGTVKALKSGLGSEQEAEQIQRLKCELATMSEQLQLFQQTKHAQDDIIAEQCTRLDASEAELKILRNDYENNERKLFYIRAEMMRLIEEIVKHLKGHLKLPSTVQSIEAFVSQPVIGNNSTEEECGKDAAILERLKQYLDAIVKSYIVVTKERNDLCKMVDLMQEQINALQREKEQRECLIDQLQDSRHATERQPSVETKEKETSIDSDIMPVPVDTRETLAAQRMRVQTVLHDMAMEIACLIGKNLSSDTLSSFSELDATPLHCLITDLKKEIESKDQVLIDRRGYIEQLEQEVLVLEKELHRLKLRQTSVDNDRLSNEKRIANLQRALQDHDGAIASLKQYNLDLQQHLEDMKDTLQTYKESIRRLGDEKANMEDECKNQLITISNLRTALEETKRNGSSSVTNLQEVIESLQSEVALLGEQLNQAFRENLSKDNELDHYRDSNLHLRCQITDLTRDLHELKDISTVVDVRRELEEQKHRHLTLMKNEMNGLQSQMAELKNEIDSRQRDCGYLTYFRDKCAELEMEHQQELQRMRSDIEALSTQLVDSKETNIQHDQLLRESNALQNTILELSNHNEILQKAIQTYHEEVEQLQQELSATKFQFTNLNQELENQKALCSEKDSKIISINAEREKLLGDLNLHKRMCKCGFNTNLKERSKTPVSHSLQKQVVQKTLEATKAADALKQRTTDFKKLENQYVEERIRLTEQTTELFTQIGKLKGKNSNLEQSLFHKEELIDRLRQNLQDVSERLVAKSEIAQTTEAKNASLSQAWEKFREDSTAREKKLSEELSSIKRNSQNQRNQLQQCENQLSWHREELDKLRGKAETLLKERDSLRQDAEDLGSKLSCFAGKESALCEVLKQLQGDLSLKTGRLAEVEDNYRKLSQAYQNLKGFNEDLTKQYQAARNHLENYKQLVEFKRQTIHTVELARKCAEESRQRERVYEQKVTDQKRIITHLQEDRVKLMEKMQDYHRDSLILNRRLEDYQQAYDDGRRHLSTSLHRTFYPSEANKLVRSSSDPNCKESDELLRRLQYTKDRIHRTREFWYRGIKEILPPGERPQM
ncbi:cingulin-like isoform X2 [Ochlerotatus camptorhynchus]|uniref:cingulin-like isoform X2 n=1 Tax=Ochlerotatus camptorhynchus TaxID=644619 RepID=UPI0031DCAF4C